MFCKNCGAIIPEGAAFCAQCGQTIEAIGQSPASGSESAQPQPAGTVGTAVRRKHLMIGAVAAVLVAVAAVAVAVVLIVQNPLNNSQVSTSADSSQQDPASSAVTDSEIDADDTPEAESKDEGTSEDAQDDSLEMKTAFDANPSSVYCAPSKVSDPINLTGTIVVHKAKEGTQEASPAGNVYLLELPSSITVTGTQYGDQENTLIALNGVEDTLLDYDGKVVTMNLCLSVRATATIAAAEYTCIHGSQITVERVFDGSEPASADTTNQSSAPAADREDLAARAGLALFTTGTLSNGEFTRTGCKVSDYLAPGSSAADKYSEGWVAGNDVVATSAEVKSHNGNTYEVEVVFDQVLSGEYAERNGNLKVHIAELSFTFDANDKIADITGTVH